MRKKISPKLFKNKKRVWIIGGIGFLVLLVLGFNLFAGGGKNDKASDESRPLQQVLFCII